MHKARHFPSLHRALISLVGIMNRQERDEALMREARISLDLALLPLLVGIERVGAHRRCRTRRSPRPRLHDGQPTNRQVGAPWLCLSTGEFRRPQGARGCRDAAGKELIAAIDAARERIGISVFKKWEEHDVAELTRLLQKFVAGVENDGHHDR
jgi:hypothetical protein